MLFRNSAVANLPPLYLNTRPSFPYQTATYKEEVYWNSCFLKFSRRHTRHPATRHILRTIIHAVYNLSRDDCANLPNEKQSVGTIANRSPVSFPQIPGL